MGNPGPKKAAEFFLALTVDKSLVLRDKSMKHKLGARQFPADMEIPSEGRAGSLWQLVFLSAGGSFWVKNRADYSRQ